VKGVGAASASPRFDRRGHVRKEGAERVQASMADGQGRQASAGGVAPRDGPRTDEEAAGGGVRADRAVKRKAGAGGEGATGGGGGGQGVDTWRERKAKKRYTQQKRREALAEVTFAEVTLDALRRGLPQLLPPHPCSLQVVERKGRPSPLASTLHLHLHAQIVLPNSTPQWIPS